MDQLVLIRDQMQDIKSDVKDIKEDISEIKTTMVANTLSLEHHVARTNQLQDIVSEFKTELVNIKDEVSKVDMEYKKHLAIINGGIKVIIGIGTIVYGLSQMGLLTKIIGLF